MTGRKEFDVLTVLLCVIIRHPRSFTAQVRMEISAPTLQRGNKDGWMMLDEALFLGASSNHPPSIRGKRTNKVVPCCTA